MFLNDNSNDIAKKKKNPLKETKSKLAKWACSFTVAMASPGMDGT